MLPGPRFFDEAEWATLAAVCGRIVPQPKDRPPVPLAAYVDEKMFQNTIDGYQFAKLLPQGEAWKAALAAIEAEARDKHGAAYHALPPTEQDAILTRMQKGEIEGPLWQECLRTCSSVSGCCTTSSAPITPTHRLERDRLAGPASPRGSFASTRTCATLGRTAEAYPGGEAKARRENDRVV